MGAIEDVERISGRTESQELARLRRELEEARLRLEEESAYFRAELEATRQRVEKQTVREHAEEVSRRRRAEQRLHELKAELRQAAKEARAARVRSDELLHQLSEAEAVARQRAREELEAERAAVRLAWQSAEEELDRVEREHEATLRLLDQERARGDALQAELARRTPDPDTVKLIGALKKALWATAQARRRAEAKLGQLSRDEAAAVHAPVVARSSDGLYNELDLDALKTLSFGDMSDELTEEFLLVPGDASLDVDTFERLQAIEEPTPEPLPEPAPAPWPPSPVQPPRDAVEPMPHYETEAVREAGRPHWIDCSRHGVGRVLRNLLIGLALTLAAYWAIDSGWLAPLLGEAPPL